MAIKNPNQLSLRVGGVDYRGWKSASITISLEHAARDFTLSVTEAWPGQDEPVRIYPEDSCEVRIGNDLVLTGFVDGVQTSHSGTDHTITVTGRSKTRDLIDCSAIIDSEHPGQFRNQSIEDIAAALAAPYLVGVVHEVPVGDRIPLFKVTVGEKVFEALERLAREKQLLLTDDEEGNLVFTRVGVLDGPAFKHPGNILSASSDFNGSDRYSEYRVKGQRAGDDDNYGKDVSGAEGTVTDPAAGTRRRVLILKGEKQMDAGACARRATWEAAVRAGKSIGVELTVQGWRDANGDLYSVNRLCPVNDDIIGVNATLLSVTVTFSLSNDGMITTFKMNPPGAYTPEAPKQKKSGTRYEAGGYVRGTVAPQAAR